MSKILERIGGYWNNVEPESIKPRDKVALYSLKVNETFFGRIQKDDWNKQVKITNNIIIVERSNTRTIKIIMCFNEEIRDAIDDLCDILSERNECLLLEYNKDQPDDKCINNIKDLLNSNDQAV
ncbi:hypothetical protein C1646_667840 [Rhizophagus diaphanus]|nr:hypothetical protein C1646_667840 [Rhizophagus diaphanus] [Rhizophagus sp. MUCL 43196]